MATGLKESEIINHDSKNLPTESQTTNQLHMLQQDIANMSAVDANKVQSVINKMASGELNIIGTEEEQLACAKRIATQIINETLQKHK